MKMSAGYSYCCSRSSSVGRSLVLAKQPGYSPSEVDTNQTHAQLVRNWAFRSLKVIQHLAIGRGWRKILALSNLKLRQKCLTQKCFSIFHFPPLVHTFFQREGRGKNSSEGPLACLSTATLFTFLLTLQIHFGKQLQSFVFAEILHGKYIL